MGACEGQFNFSRLTGKSGHSKPGRGETEFRIKFFAKLSSKKAEKRSRPVHWDESAENASWCHPSSERPGRSLKAPCCGGEAAPVSRPAAGAVFGRAVSVRLSQPGRSALKPLSVRWISGYSCAVIAVNATMLPYFPQNVKEMWKLTGQKAPGWGSCRCASPGRPGPGRGSAAPRWPHWWPWGRSARRTGGRCT